MHNVFNSQVDADADDSGIRSRSNSQGTPDSNVESKEGNTALPSDGYRIFDSRPSISIPTAPHDAVSLYRAEGSGARRFVQSLVSCSVKNWSNILLCTVPIGILAPQIGMGDSAVFVLNCIAIIPLADVLCRATDACSVHLGDTAGALLNVTMGNATEVVIFHALLTHQYMIVRTSLLGSIIVNTLLVLGVAIVTGEYQERGQTYSLFATRIAAALLVVTTIGLLIPSTLHTTYDPKKVEGDVLNLSRGISVVLILLYMLYLSTQIGSSKYAYTPLIQVEPATPIEPEFDHQMSDIPRASFHRRTLSYPRDSPNPSAYDDLPVYNAEPRHGLGSSSRTKLSSIIRKTKSSRWIQTALPVIALMTATILISVCGELLVNSIDHFVDRSPLSKTMVGLIILPIVGNAAELVSAFMFASRKQMDLAFAVSIGSAIQMALFVTPLLVVVGWIMGRSLALHFTVFEGATLVLSTALFGCMTLGNKCSLMKGGSLFAGYALIAFFTHFVANFE